MGNLPTSHPGDAWQQNILAPNSIPQAQRQLQDSGTSNSSFTRNSANNICAAPRTNKHGQEAFTNPGCVNCFWECLQMSLPENIGGFWWKTHRLWHTDNKANTSFISSLDSEIKKEKSHICAQEPISKLPIQLCWTVWIEWVRNVGFTPQTSSVAPHGVFIAWKWGICEE